MEQHKIKEALSLDVFLHSLLKLTNCNDASEADDINEQFVLPTPHQTQETSQKASYVFELEEPRQWIKDLMMEDSSESEEESIEELLRIHLKTKIYREQYNSDPMLAKFMFYSSDALTGDNKWPAHCQSIEKKCLKRKARRFEFDRKKKTTTDGEAGRARKMSSPFQSSSSVKSCKAQSNKSGRSSKRSTTATSSFQDGSSRCYHSRNKSHGVSDKITQGNMVKKRALTMSRKRSMNIAALRRYIWKIIIKKEIPKAYRQHMQNHSNKLTLLKKVSKDASKKIRARALESRLKAKKEIIVARARRMTREAQLFWKKYVRVEKSQRKHAEKQALTQRRIEDERREAFKQEQKLRFLITQTELYAHFVSGKSREEILQEKESCVKLYDHIDESDRVNVVDADCDDIEFSDARAFENANNAFLLHQSKLEMYSNAKDLFKERAAADEEVTDKSQPNLVCGQLTGYQLTGVNWLFNLYRHGLNGILADDMGLGKTVQTIAFFAGLAERHYVWGPFLVIAPASTLNNWHQEFSRFLPAFKILPYWGTTSERKVLRLFWNQTSEAKAQASAPFHVMITSYQLATTDMRYFQKIPWHYIVFDEAHALKSSNSIRWRTLLDFKCRNRLLLTGTPVQNTMAEHKFILLYPRGLVALEQLYQTNRLGVQLWALLHFIMPTLFDNHAEFNEWFAKNIESYVDNKSAIEESDLTRLHRILKPFILRRLKCDVEHELTEKVEVRVLCHLSPRQKVMYDALQKKILVKELLRAQSYSGQSTNNIVLMNLVMQFRKVCNHPDIFRSRETSSPFHFNVPAFVFPRLFYSAFFATTSQRKHYRLFYSDLNVHAPCNVHSSLQELAPGAAKSSFSFLPFINMTAGQYWKFFSGSLNDCNEDHPTSLLAKYRQLANVYCAKMSWLAINKMTVKQRLEQLKHLFINMHKRVHMRIFWNQRLHCYVRTLPDTSSYMRFKNTQENTTNLTDITVTFYIAQLWDLCNYLSLYHSLLKKFLFVVPSESFSYGFCNHTITRLTNSDDVMDKIKNDEDQTQSSKISGVLPSSRHRIIESVRENVLTKLPGLLLSQYHPKVYCNSRDVYCGDNGALHYFRRLSDCLKESLTEVPYTNHICIPDRELLVSDSGKLAALDMLLRRLKDGGHRVLVYSQMTKMIDILEEYMLMRRHSYVRLDGSCRISSRRDTVAGFQSSTDIFVFLLSTRAGGQGINLTAADTVIFYDSDWNPTVDQQAMDRAHRLGQTKQVTVYRLVCKGTVDERILARAEAKSTIQRMVIQDGNFKKDPLNQTEMVSLLLDDDQIAKASQTDNVLKTSLENAKMTGKRKYRRKTNTDGIGRKKLLRDKKSRNVEQNQSIYANVERNSAAVISNEAESKGVNVEDPNSSGSTDEQLVVVDDVPAEISAPTDTSSLVRGQRKRGRPRLRPIIPSNKTRIRPPLQRRKIGSRGRGRGVRGKGRGRIFTGRAAAMAGARAGALAATAATLQAQGASSFST